MEVESGRLAAAPFLLCQTGRVCYRPFEYADVECRGKTADALQGLVEGVFALWLKEQSMQSVGIDISKDQIECAFGGEVRTFANSSAGHVALLDWAGGAGQWCMEATGRYYERVARFGYDRGIRSVVVNPGKAKKYLEFVSYRGKTDKMDALALARMAEQEGENLRAYKPVPEAVAQARDIMVRRRALVEARVSLEQVAGAAGDPQGHLTDIIRGMKATQEELERELAKALKGYEGYKLLLTIPGIGPLSAAILVCTLERGEFLTSDSLVAFAGLDPRANDSGKRKGKRMLSHQGDAQLRTILYMAARAGARLPVWKPYYVSQMQKGLPTTAATVILARKLLRVAWSVYRQKAPFIHHEQTPPLDKPT